MNHTKFLYHFCLWFGLMIQATTLCAQTSTAYHKNFSARDGLPTKQLYWLEQSEDGKLWIGSSVGLLSFDGLEFKTYFNEGARNNSISDLEIDSLGNIWAINFSNQLFYFQNDSLHLIQAWEDFPKGEWPLLDVVSIDKKRCYITMINGKSYIYNNENQTVTEDSLLGWDGFLNHPLWIDDQHRFRFSRDKLFYVEQGLPTKVLSSKELPESKNNAFRLEYRLTKSPIGPIMYLLSYYDFTNESNPPFLFKLQADTLLPIHVPFELNKAMIGRRIINLEWQNDSILWLATSNGAFCWNLRTNKFKHYLKGVLITDVLIDREGGIWASSLMNGLYYISSTGVEVSGIQKKVLLEKDDLGNLLIVHSRNKLSYIDGNTHKIIQERELTLKTNIERIKFNPYLKKFLLVQRGEYLLYFDAQTAEIEKTKEFFRPIKDVTFDRCGNIYVAEGHGAMGFNLDSLKKGFLAGDFWKRNHLDTVPHIEWNRNRKQYFNKTFFCEKCKVYNNLLFTHNNIRYYSIAHLEEKGELFFWLGSSNGLYFLEKLQAKAIKGPKGGGIIVRDFWVNEKDTSTWVATNNQGVMLIKKDSILQQINRAKGLPSSDVYSLEMHNGYLWAGTQKGIARINPQTFEVLHWNPIMGIPSEKTERVRGVGSHLYFSMNNQLMFSPISPLVNKSSMLPVEITEFRVNGQSVDFSKTIKIPYEENSVQITYLGVSLKSQGVFKYYYRLQNVENKWIPTSAYNRSIRYPNLSPGKYSFEVKVVDVVGNESVVPARIEFEVLAPFYQTWPFYLLCLIVVIGLFSLLILILKYRERKRNEALIEKNKEKLIRYELQRDLRIAQLKALKAQMNPHFIFNVLNSIQALFLTNDKRTGNRLLSQFSKLIRLTLDRSEELEVSLEDELNLLNIYLNVEYMRTQQGFEYDVKVDESLDMQEIYLPSLLLQPYIENALKHGLMHKKGERKLIVEFNLLKRDFLEIKIDDNGIGREASREQRAKGHKSFSTLANHRRLQLFNLSVEQKIELNIIDKVNKDLTAGGTTVQIIFPLNN